jgi:(S)-ureidoglycine aminohydrolase
MFDRATAMTKRFEMHVTTLNEGLWSHPPHTHRAAEILLLIDNTAHESIDGKLLPATVGDIIFLESNVPHAIQNTSSGSSTYFAFQFE